MPSKIKLAFPNPYGFPLPIPKHVDALQNLYNFSNSYADFLKIQNGFSSILYGYGEEAKSYFIETHEILTEGEDFAFLYGFTDDDSGNLVKIINLYPELTDYLLPFGRDSAGNTFVEVLIGKQKGEIGCLNHETFDGSINELMAEMEVYYRDEKDKSAPAVIELNEKIPSALDENGKLKKVTDLNPEEKIALLMLEQWDVYARTANTFNNFIDNIIVVKEDEYYSLYVKDQ